VLDSVPADVIPVCASHILVATADEADAVVARLDDGEDFATVASEVSTDTGSGAAGGSLGCNAPAQYVAEFRDALIGLEDGARSGPVESQFGFHIISREGVDTSSVTTADVIGLAARDIAIGALQDADVDVLERLGTWDVEANPPQVIVRL
jgi:parvulin-like peptidyl-prolyl isomerase